MKKIVPNEEYIVEKYERVLGFVKLFTCQKRFECIEMENLLKMIEDNSERYALCPASSNSKYFCCFPGGLTTHTLNVLKIMNKLNQKLDMGLSDKSIVMVSILHCFGKIGADRGDEPDYYLPTQENWKINKGQFYDVNQNILFMRPVQRSLYWAQAYEICLSPNEYVSILASDVSEERQYYNFKVPKLGLVLEMAIRLALEEEKHYNIIYPLA